MINYSLLKKYRLLREYSLEFVSEKLGLSVELLKDIEDNGYVPTAHDCIKLCRFYDISITRITRPELYGLSQNELLDMYICGDISEGGLCNFLGLDRISARLLVEKWRRR